jgi:hypothetical protein
MTTMPPRDYLPRDAAERFPQLSHFESQGLPSSIRWRFHSSGPEFRFDFGMLGQGGIQYEQADIQRSQWYYPDISDMLRIGSYIYAFLDLQQQSDVCARTKDGSLWIIDLKRESIVTLFHGNEMMSERIPVFVQYVNSQPDQFEKCISVFLELVERFRQPTKDKAAVRNAWTQFEDYIRQTDPQALKDDTSYWLGTIGERLGPY